MERFIPILGALPALLLAWPAGAGSFSVLYEHPKREAKVTVHFAQKGQNPEALTYQGPKGIYLVTRKDLYELGTDDPHAQQRYNIYRLAPGALGHQEDLMAGESRWPYAEERIVGALESIIASLVKARSKEQAPSELKARIKALGAKAKAAETRRKALEVLEQTIPGSLKDKKRLESLQDEIASAGESVEEVESTRAEVEPNLERLMDPNPENSNPKAAFYWAMGRLLDASEEKLGQAEKVLDWLPKK